MISKGYWIERGNGYSNFRFLLILIGNFIYGDNVSTADVAALSRL